MFREKANTDLPSSAQALTRLAANWFGSFKALPSPACYEAVMRVHARLRL